MEKAESPRLLLMVIETTHDKVPTFRFPGEENKVQPKKRTYLTEFTYSVLRTFHQGQCLSGTSDHHFSWKTWAGNGISPNPNFSSIKGDNSTCLKELLCVVMGASICSMYHAMPALEWMPRSFYMNQCLTLSISCYYRMLCSPSLVHVFIRKRSIGQVLCRAV